MKKFLLLSIIVLFVLSISAPSVFAQRTPQRSFPNASSAANLQDKKQDRMEKQTTNRLERAEKEIARRLTKLEQLMTRITAKERLSAAIVATLSKQIQAEIDALTALQTKIQAGEDIAEADLQAIRNTYNSYALYLQKTHILAAADQILSTADLMSSQAAQLQTKITTAQTAGNDVTELQRLLADMEANITDATTQAQTAITTVTPLTSAGYPDNRTQLQNAREMIRAGHKSLLDARYSANQMITLLVKLRVSTASVTPQLTCIPRPICLDATPACKIAEPANGWCPASTTNASGTE